MLHLKRLLSGLAGLAGAALFMYILFRSLAGIIVVAKHLAFSDSSVPAVGDYVYASIFGGGAILIWAYSLGSDMLKSDEPVRNEDRLVPMARNVVSVVDVQEPIEAQVKEDFEHHTGSLYEQEHK